MYQLLLLTVYYLLFTLITYHNIKYGLFLLFLLLPTYLIRFNIGPFPATLLEIMIWIIFFIWILKEKKLHTKKGIITLTSYLLHLASRYRLLTLAIALLLIAATISVCTSTNTLSALGQYKAFYIEPILIFLILITIKDKKQNFRPCASHLAPLLIFAIIICALATSTLAIYQHFTGWMVPWAFWENGASYRATGWYGFPNGVGLFLAPIIPLVLYKIIQNLSLLKNKNWGLVNSNWKYWIRLISYTLCLLTIPLAVLFAKSTGGLIGILSGLGFLLLIYKKTRIPIIIISIVSLISILSLPNLSNIKTEIFAKDRSGQIRISMWKEASQFLFHNPLFGAGLASYQEKIIPYHKKVNNENIEIFHHPHNIFLTMYVNLGLLGLVGFILILVSFFKTGLPHIKYHILPNTKNLPHQSADWSRPKSGLPIFLTASMITLLTTGLVDSPYIKNDLSIFFWLIIALAVLPKSKKTSKKHLSLSK